MSDSLSFLLEIYREAIVEILGNRLKRMRQETQRQIQTAKVLIDSVDKFRKQNR